MTRTTPITFLLLIVLMSIPAFGEDFFASAPQATIRACQCQEVINPITVRNTNLPEEGLTITINGGVKDTKTVSAAGKSSYTIIQDGKTAEWSTLFPGFFTLEAGDTQVIEEIITVPCGAEGDFPLKTVITTQSGMEKILEQTLEVRECSNVQITSTNTRAESCPCSPVQYEFTLKNQGEYTDTFLIGARGKGAGYITLSENALTLNAGESKLIYVFLNSPCSYSGELTFEILVESQKNDQLEMLPMQASITPCYDFEVETGKLIHLYEDNASFEAFQGTYAICEKEPHILIPLRVKNTADIRNDYLFILDGPKWASLSHNVAPGLGKDEYSEFHIILEPWAYLDQDETLSLEVRSSIGDVRQTFEIPLSVSRCSTPYLFQDIRKISVNYSVISTLLSIENAGSQAETYDLSINLDWAEIQPDEITLQPGESKDFELITFPSEDTRAGKYDAVISALSRSNGVGYDKDISIRLSGGSLWDDMNAKTSGYLMYLLIGLIILILIIVFLSWGRKKGHPGERIDEQTERVVESKEEKTMKSIEPIDETEEKKGPSFWKWCCLILIILLIAVGLWYAYSRLGLGESMGGWFEKNETASGTSGLENETSEGAIAEEGEGGISGKFFTQLLGFFTVYLWYILIGILLAIIIIIILSLSGKKKEGEKEDKVTSVDEEPVIIEKKAKTKKKPQKTTSEEALADEKRPKGKLSWIIFSLLLLALILIIAWRFGYSWYTQQEVEDTTPTVDFTGVDCLATWPKNTQKTINLTIGFSDPDGDQLMFSSNEPEHVKIAIDDRGMATIDPELDYSGVVDVIFFAEDGRGFRVPTGNLSLCITDEDIDPITKARGFYEENRTILIISGIIVFLILLFVIFNKPIINFLEEDDDVPDRKNKPPKH